MHVHAFDHSFELEKLLRDASSLKHITGKVFLKLELPEQVDVWDTPWSLQMLPGKHCPRRMRLPSSLTWWRVGRALRELIWISVYMPIVPVGLWILWDFSEIACLRCHGSSQDKMNSFGCTNKSKEFTTSYPQEGLRFIFNWWARMMSNTFFRFARWSPLSRLFTAISLT